MMRRVRDRRDDLPLSADVNITSLVDVAFTLLVIFIITAPVLQGGLEIAIPKADVQALNAEQDPLFVGIERDGRIFLGETEMSIQDFRDGFNQLAEAGTFERVYVRGDSLAPYGTVLQVMSVIRNAEVNFAAVAEPWASN
jgi:biopolymer transport protein TolR